MISLERAYAEKKAQDDKIESLSAAKIKWFKRIYHLDTHASLSVERVDLIKYIFGSLTIDTVLFVYKMGYDAGLKRAAREAKREARA